MDDEAARSPSPPPLHVVICPWLAFGHLLPYLELAERLASRGHRVSFLSTPRNLLRLPPRRQHAAGAIELVALPLPLVEGLPDGAESTNDVRGDKLAPLFEAFDGLAAPFADFLTAACASDNGEGNHHRRPDWIVADTFHHWAPAVAQHHKIPCEMLVSSAAVLSAFACGARDHAELAGASAAGCGTIYEHLSAAAVDAPPASMPRYEWERNARLFVPHERTGMSIIGRIALTLQRCAVTAMRGCPEWEGEAFAHAAALLGKPLLPLGLLPPPPDGAGGMNGDDAAVRWLDAQPSKSVVYVALGSEVPLSVEQVHELALGLELAGTRFLWALRTPRGGGGVSAMNDVLPPGFLERTHGHGLVATSWVPQTAVLAHGAVGAFLTHSGRSSLIEGLVL